MLVGGVLKFWQAHQPRAVPPAIRILPVSAEQVVAISNQTASLPPVPPEPLEPGQLLESTSDPDPTEALPPVSPALAPSSDPIQDATSPDPDPPLTAPISSPPAPEPDVAPSPLAPIPPVETETGGYRPTAPDPGWSIDERPFPSTTGELALEQGDGFLVNGYLQPVPGGRDIPQKLPVAPAGWNQSVADLMARSACSQGILPPGTSTQIVLFPIVEANGGISEFLPWEEGGSGDYPALVSCLESLRSQLPPLIPAMEGGSPVPSYAALLILEISSR